MGGRCRADGGFLKSFSVCVVVGGEGVAGPVQEVQKQEVTNKLSHPQTCPAGLHLELSSGPCSSQGHHQMEASSNIPFLSQAGLPSSFPSSSFTYPLPPTPTFPLPIFPFPPGQILGLLSAFCPREPVADANGEGQPWVCFGPGGGGSPGIWTFTFSQLGAGR